MSEPRLTGQEYLQRLRERRLDRSGSTSNATAPAPEVAAPATQPTSPEQPTATTASTQAGASNTAQTNNTTAAFGTTPAPQEYSLFSWQAPSRPFKKRSRQYYTTLILIVILICAILFFAGQFLPIAVVISVAFLAYILASVPPEIVEHHFTNVGLRADNSLFYWEELSRFWFTTKFDQPVLHFECTRFPFRVTVLMGEVSPESMREMLATMMPEQKPQPSPYERAAEWLQKKVPLEIDK